MSHVQRALIALVLVAGVAGHAGQVKADAISDQKKVYKALGAEIQPETEKCTIFTKSDAERVLGGPVVHLETDMVKSACAYGRANDHTVGLTVDRGPRSNWTIPKTNSSYYNQVHHVKGVGQDAYTLYNNGLGYEADVLTPKGVITVNLSGVGNASTALSVARMVMNR
jgi:hypothetical protein